MVYFVKVSKGKTSMFTKLEREPTMELCTAMHCHALPCTAMHCHALPCTAMHCPTKVAFVGFPQSLPRCRMSHGLCSMSKALEKLLSNAMPVDTLKLRCARDAQGAAE